MRALRFSLRNKSIFSEQLRALLRAGVNAELTVMFPLVSSVDDVLEARSVIIQCVDALRSENAPHNPSPRR